MILDSNLTAATDHSERESRRVKANFETLMHSPAIADYWSTPDEYSEVVLILTGLFSKVEKPMGLTITDILGERNKKEPLLCPHIHFYVDVCRGLPYRVMAAVRAYLRNSVSDLKPVSQLSEKEIRKVLRLKRKGKRNYEIGYKVRVKPVDVAHLIQSQLTPDLQYISKAPFTLDEDRRLVRKCKRKAGISYLHEWKPRMVQKMDWNQIASQMPGRSVEQCRLRLKIVLLPARYTERMKLIEMKKRLMKKDRIQLIYFLHREEEEGMRSEREIDWAALSVKMKHLPMKEAVYLVSDLKDQVPQDITAFPDRIRWLYDEFLPSFTDLSEEKLKELREWYDEPIGFNQ